MLGPVGLSSVLDRAARLAGDTSPAIHWVIAGGESGPGARPCELDWLRDLRDQCRGAGAVFFLKQLGAVAGRQAGCRDAKGADLEAWPFDLRIREMPVMRGESAR